MLHIDILKGLSKGNTHIPRMPRVLFDEDKIINDTKLVKKCSKVYFWLGIVHSGGKLTFIFRVVHTTSRSKT